MMLEKSKRSFFCTCVIFILLLVPVSQVIPLNLHLLPSASGASGIGTIYISNVKNTSATVTTSPFQASLTNFNVGTGTSRLLVVAVEADNKSVNSVTFNGGSVTRSLTQASGSFQNEYTAFWYLTNPVGTGNVTVTMAGATQAIVGAYALSGVDQATPIPTTATNYTQASSPIDPNPNISLTTQYPNSVVLDSAALYGGSQLSSPSCAQEWSKQMVNKVTGASSNTTRALAGPVTCKWHNSVTQNGWDDTAIEIKAAGASPQASPIILNGKSTATGFVPAASSTVTLYNFSAGTGSNRLLVVGVTAGHQSASSVKFGGASLTKAVSSFVNNDAEFWYLKNPSYNPANVVVTMSGSTEASAFVIGTYSFANVNQTNPIPTTATNHDTCSPSCTNPTVSITTASPNDLVLDLPSIWGGKSLSSPTCNQQWDSNMQYSSLHKTTGASSSTVVPVSATVSCSWTASGTSDFWDDVAIDVKAVSLTATTGIWEPLYCDPYTNDTTPCTKSTSFAWQNVVNNATQHPHVPYFAIVNPDSGPGSPPPTCDPSNRTHDYNRGITNLINAGVKVLGYVDTNYGNRNYPTVIGDVNTWVSCYPNIQGIMYDRMNYPGSGQNIGKEDYYQNLTSYVKKIKGLTYALGNPGSPTGQTYVNSGAADTIDIFEQNGNVPTISQLQGDSFSTSTNDLGYDRHNFSFLSYTRPSLPSGATIGNQSNFVGLMYYTDDGADGNPWDTIASYLSSLITHLDNNTAIITINATGPSGPLTGLLVQVSQNGTVVPSGYTPHSYLGTTGVKYIFTPQNSGSCTFQKWKDTSSTTAARTILVNSTSKAFTAVYTGTLCN
jgi:hypothetical protein